MKTPNFYINGEGRLNPFVDADGYTDGLGDAPEGDLGPPIEDFLPSPEYMRRHFGVRIVSDEQAAREDAELAARKAATAREKPSMPRVDRARESPYAPAEAMMLRDSAAAEAAR